MGGSAHLSTMPPPGDRLLAFPWTQLSGPGPSYGQVKTAHGLVSASQVELNDVLEEFDVDVGARVLLGARGVAAVPVVALGVRAHVEQHRGARGVARVKVGDADRVAIHRCRGRERAREKGSGAHQRLAACSGLSHAEQQPYHLGARGGGGLGLAMTAARTALAACECRRAATLSTHLLCLFCRSF